MKLTKEGYENWDVHEAIDGLMAYDFGCLDSGIRTVEAAAFFLEDKKQASAEMKKCLDRIETV